MKRLLSRTAPLFALLLALLLLLPACSVDTGKTVMSYRNVNLGESLYTYWNSVFKRNILSYYNDITDTEECWNTDFRDGKTIGEYFSEITDQQIRYYLISQRLFREMNLSLSKEQTDAIDQDIQEKIDGYGSRAELNAVLATIGANIEILREAYLWEARSNAVYSALFAAGGRLETTKEQLSDYYKSHYSRMEYIVFYTTKLVTDKDGNYVYDDEGYVKSEEMTEEEINAVKVRANEALARTGEYEFSDLMKEYSEYDVSELYPGGLYVSENEVSTYGYAIVAALASSEPDEYTLVYDDYAIYLVHKLPLPAFDNLSDADIRQLSAIEGYCEEESYHTYMDKLAEEVKENKDLLASYDFRTIKPSPSATL